MINITNKALRLMILPILLLLGFFLLSFDINKPFIGHHDWNAVFFGNIAKNTAKFGFIKTKFGAVYTFLPQQVSDFKFHTHQPPMLHLLLGLEAKIIGVHEWSMRLLSIIFSLIALYFIYKTAESLYGWKTAVMASLFFIFNPMFIYFGKLPVHEPLGLGVIAYSFYRYMIFYKKNQGKKNLIYLGLSILVACQTVWAGYYLAPLYIIHYWVFNAKKLKNSKILLLIIIPFISFFSHLLHILFLTGGWDTGLFKTLFFRMQIGEKASWYNFTILQYIKQESLWLTVYFTRTLCFLSIIYILFLIKKIINKTINFKDGFLIMLFIFGLIDPIIFRNLCYIHDYKLIFIIFAISLSGAVALKNLNKGLNFLWKKNKTISLFLFLLIFIAFAVERLEFSKALLATEMNKPAYNLGLILQQNSKSDEEILIGSETFAEFQDIFLKFYGQRRIIYFKPDLQSFKESLSERTRLIVFVKDREKPAPELLKYLEQNYLSFERNDFLFFDLKTDKK